MRDEKRTLLTWKRGKEIHLLIYYLELGCFINQFKPFKPFRLPISPINNREGKLAYSLMIECLTVLGHLKVECLTVVRVGSTNEQFTQPKKG